MKRLDGKVALVTGAGGGIGLAVCAALAREGARLVCVDRDPAAADAASEAVRAAGGEARPVAGDVAVEATSEQAVGLALAAFGRLDVAVTAAVHDLPLGPITGIALADWRRATAVNVDSAFLLAKHAIPVMAAGGGGSIVLIGSELARVALPGRAWYCAQKAAIVQLARALAVDHAAQGIRVNSLSPGPVETDRYLRKFPTREQAHAASGTLFGRAAAPEEVASAAVFLASDDSRFVTGTDLLVDGGRTAM